jgi:hypothetical protein
MKRNLFIFFLFSLTTILIAQGPGEITGHIKDANSKHILPGANIVVLGTLQGAASDQTGHYNISNLQIGTYRLEFSYIGYTTQLKTDVVVRSSKPTILDVELVPENLESETIVVSAGYFAREKLTQPSVIGLSREEIRRFPGGFEDIVRTVSILPGVSINPSGGRNDLLVRGGGPAENLYVINNVEVPNINHFGTQGTGSGSLSFINLDFVDNVLFSAGGFSAQYGEKMSSILSINMGQGRGDKFGGKALISATQFGLNVEGPLSSNGNVIFSARQSYLDLIFKAAGFPFVPVYTDFNLLANYEISPQDIISIIGLSAIDRIERNLDTPKNRVFNASILDNTQNQYIGGLNYRRIHKNGYADLTLSSTLYRFRFSQADTQQVEYFNSKADEAEYLLKGIRFREMSEHINLIFGFNIRLNNNLNRTTFADTIYDRNGLRIPIEKISVKPVNTLDTWTQTYAAFVETDWDIFKNINFNLGFRFNYYHALNNPLYLAPRFALKFQIDAKHALKLNLGQYYQSPAPVWLVNPYNKNLKALQNNMAIIGWDCMIRDDIRFTTEFYYKHYLNLPTGIIANRTDYIVMSNTGSGYGGREDDFQSFGYFDLNPDAHGNAYGVELLLQKKFSDIPIYGKVGITLSKSEVVAGNGKTYPAQFDQRFIFNLSAGYKINTSWEISGKFRYFTGIPYTPVYRPSENPVHPGSLQNIPEEYLISRLEDGHHLDLRVDRYYNFKKWTLILFLDIQNVYNYPIPTIPRYDFWENTISKTNSIGILPSIGISAEF